MSTYFNRFPVILDYEIQGYTLTGVDITRRTGFLAEARNNPKYYFPHTVQDGETAIILADRIYDDAQLDWVILMFNEIHDINNQWPLMNYELDAYIARTYDDPSGIHHYESLYSGATVDSDWPQYDRVSISNYDYEFKINEAKRNIRIPIPNAAGAIVNEHHRLIQE